MIREAPAKPARIGSKSSHGSTVPTTCRLGGLAWKRAVNSDGNDFFLRPVRGSKVNPRPTHSLRCGLYSLAATRLGSVAAKSAAKFLQRNLM